MGGLPALGLFIVGWTEGETGSMPRMRDGFFIQGHRGGICSPHWPNAQSFIRLFAEDVGIYALDGDVASVAFAGFINVTG